MRCGCTIIVYSFILTLNLPHVQVDENMKTFHVLKLFQDYGPECVEWMSGTRCNIVFGDPGSAKRCLMQLSKAIAFDNPGNVQEQLAGLGAAPHDLEYLNWRVSQFHTSESSLLFRVATELDVKKPLAERRDDKYFKLYWQKNRDAWAHKVKAEKARQRAEKRSRPKEVKKISLKKKAPMAIKEGEAIEIAGAASGAAEGGAEKVAVPTLTMTIERTDLPGSGGEEGEDDGAGAVDAMMGDERKSLKITVVRKSDLAGDGSRGAVKRAKRQIRLKKKPYGRPVRVMDDEGNLEDL